MSEEFRIPIVEETAHVFKRAAVTDRVTVRTGAEEHPVTIREQLFRGHVVTSRVPIDREVTEAPPIRTEGEVTIVPIVEERLVIEKRLFLVEELHLTRETALEHVEISEVLRRTRVDIDRDEPSQQETI
ncbi:YsnF/AvaK domain-containing protein [Sphingomonas sp.]|jgi:stress response protein YsnF|uniref:YsnF/AvaK domain-containing protein n=1 Tax=Sphingomonas sp. TaxID=28214 RepID=UPI002D7F3C89|nr:YsnF/AvaK domain-containing protein [Sphingomonas sp.]HEU0043088.1 YsnF/AvaK domain-containing protein [Sphingomonas sp.]